MTRSDAYENVTDCRAMICSGQMRYPDAVRLFRRFYTGYPRTDIRLLEYARDHAPQSLPFALRVLAAVSDGTRLVNALRPLYNNGEQRKLRAQIAGLLARSLHDWEWASEALSDPDPRLRANVVEGIRAWSSDPELPLRALYDVHHRVAVNACISLVAMNHDAGRRTLELFLTDSRWQFRTAACWAFGVIRAPEDSALVAPLQEDPHPFVRSHARAALAKIAAGPELESNEAAPTNAAVEEQSEPPLRPKVVPFAASERVANSH